MVENNRYKRTIIKEHVHSKHLNQDRSIRIFLPPGYNELISYPVVYCQDGEQFFNYGRIGTVATTLILEEDVEPFIVVGIDVDIETRTEEYSPDGDLYPHYCAFIAEELIPYIEDRVSARSEPEARILAGDSLGGTVSLHLALLYPGLFHQVLSFSGAFFESTLHAIQEESNLSELDIYMLIGLQENDVETARGRFDLLALNRLTHQLLKEKQASVVYYEEDGTHVWGFWQQYMAQALRHFLF
jgi:enterochelin esterase-like enzyme